MAIKKRKVTVHEIIDILIKTDPFTFANWIKTGKVVIVRKLHEAYNNTR